MMKKKNKDDRTTLSDIAIIASGFFLLVLSLLGAYKFYEYCSGKVDEHIKPALVERFYHK